jgi:hypothetical protein
MVLFDKGRANLQAAAASRNRAKRSALSAHAATRADGSCPRRARTGAPGRIARSDRGPRATYSTETIILA